jgi:hypothetical protein
MKDIASDELGAADPVTPRAQMDALEDELSAAKVDW